MLTGGTTYLAYQYYQPSCLPVPTFLLTIRTISYRRPNFTVTHYCFTPTLVFWRHFEIGDGAHARTAISFNSKSCRLIYKKHCDPGRYIGTMPYHSRQSPFLHTSAEERRTRHHGCPYGSGLSDERRPELSEEDQQQRVPDRFGL